VGQSHFRCDLAVRRPGDRVYRLGILTDGEAYYEQSDILERDVMRPKLLRNFGWNICQVFAKEWYEAPERVIHRVLQLIDGQSEAEPGRLHHKLLSEEDLLQVGVVPTCGEAFVLDADLEHVVVL